MGIREQESLFKEPHAPSRIQTCNFVCWPKGFVYDASWTSTQSYVQDLRVVCSDEYMACVARISARVDGKGDCNGQSASFEVGMVRYIKQQKSFSRTEEHSS